MPREKAGQPAFKPTDDERKLVEQMTACGIPQESQCLASAILVIPGCGRWARGLDNGVYKNAV